MLSSATPPTVSLVHRLPSAATHLHFRQRDAITVAPHPAHHAAYLLWRGGFLKAILSREAPFPTSSNGLPKGGAQHLGIFTRDLDCATFYSQRILSSIFCIAAWLISTTRPLPSPDGVEERTESKDINCLRYLKVEDGAVE